MILQNQSAFFKVRSRLRMIYMLSLLRLTYNKQNSYSDHINYYLYQLNYDIFSRNENRHYNNEQNHILSRTKR